MSEAAAAREWRLDVEDMIAFCDKALDYTTGLECSTFAAERMRYDATLRNLELIGEAATHVPDDVRQAAADVPWRMVVAALNRLIHGYLGIDDDTLWSIIRDDLVPLRGALTRLLAAQPQRADGRQTVPRCIPGRRSWRARLWRRHQGNVVLHRTRQPSRWCWRDLEAQGAS